MEFFHFAVCCIRALIFASRYHNLQYSLERIHMKKSFIGILSVIALILLSSCSKQNSVEIDNGAITTLSGQIKNWTFGSGKSLAMVYYIVTTEESPDTGWVMKFGTTNISAQGEFKYEPLPAVPDSMFHMNNNVGLFESYPIFFHGYTVTQFSVLDANSKFLNYAFYSTQSVSVVPYTNNDCKVGDYSMFLQYSDRDITIDSSSSGVGVFDLTLNFKYKVALKKGWNKLYVVITGVSTTTRDATWTTEPPAGEAEWHLTSRYFKSKNLLGK